MSKQKWEWTIMIAQPYIIGNVYVAGNFSGKYNEELAELTEGNIKRFLGLFLSNPDAFHQWIEVS